MSCTVTTILDTNVVSELTNPAPNPIVLAWWNRQQLAEMYTTTITEAELRYGLAIMPAGRYRNNMAMEVEDFLAFEVAGRILSFDRAAAHAYARIYADRRLMGRPTSPSDCQIAAIALAQGMGVATRNIADFADCGVELVNPWLTEGTA